MSNNIKEFINQLPIITMVEKELLLKHWNVKKTFSRKDFLIQPNEREIYLYFIEKGTFRIYYDIDDNEACVGFSYPNTLIFAYRSFITGEVSKYFIQTLSTAELIAIPRSTFLSLVDEYPKIAKMWQKVTEQALLGRIEREIDLLTPSPKERYVRLLKRSPHVFQFISNKYIASYLRMTPETLSRIQKNYI
jgi:CRP-like cAMP-binding protein